MRIVRESQAGPAGDVPALDEAWRDPETFAFIPQRTAVSAQWVEAALATLPAGLQRGHFALLTSGSTGLPKLVIGARGRSEALVRALHDAQKSAEVEETLVALPLSYCYAFVNQWLWARTFGRRLVPTPGFAQPDELWKSLRQAKSAMLCLVGAQVALLERFFGAGPFGGVIRLHFAGGRFPEERLDYLRQLFPSALIFNNYGCAEAMPRLTLRQALGKSTAHDIGRPLPGIELRAAPESQELSFRSPYGAVGFVDQDRKFHAITDDEWVATGDLASAEQDGSFRLLGRAGEVFKRHGEKIALPVLLGTVSQHWPGQAAFYREKDAAGEDGCVLVLAPHPAEPELRRVLKGFRDHHPRAHWPLRIESVEVLPALASGKPDTESLAKLADKQLKWKQPG
jgi:acyl-CoA synthetase (AMP-forming)/AMP-acid ligase II